MGQQRQVGTLGQFFRQRQRFAQDRLHALFELRRMCGPQEQAVFTWVKLVAQRTIGNRRVRFRGIPHRLQLAHGGFGGLIRHRSIAQVTQAPDLTAEQLFHARPVVRLRHIHRIGEGRLRGVRRPLPVFQEARHGVIGVGGGDKAFHRQTQGFRQQACRQIAEVTARHGDHQLIARVLRQLRHRFEVVANLRQQTADVDGVGGVQTQRHLQLFVVEGLLDQRLTGIEIAVNCHGFNVAAEGAEQFLLQRADFAFRIEDHHADVFQAVERVGDRRAGIPGGRGQDGHRLVATDVGQHLRHKAAAEVFERQRRTVEQLQAANIRLNLLNRRRERECRAYALFQQLLRNFIADKRGQNFGAAGDKILLQQVINLGQLEFRQVMREKQPLIFAQSLSHRLREADLLVMIFKVVEFH